MCLRQIHFRLSVLTPPSLFAFETTLPLPWFLLMSTGKWQQNLRDVWSQSPENLPMHIDIPRLITKIFVVSEGGTTLWPSDHVQVEDLDHIYSLFKLLAEKLGDSNLPAIKTGENRRPDEVVPQLEAFFASEGASNSTTVRLLKVCFLSSLLPHISRPSIRRCYFLLIIKSNTPSRPSR